MLEIYYLMAHLFDFYCMPFIPLSEVIDLYFGTPWIERLHRTLQLIFPVLRERQFQFAFVSFFFFNGGPRMKGHLKAQDGIVAVIVSIT